MKQVVEYYQRQGILFRSLEPVPPKLLGSRKRVAIYLGVDTEQFYVMVIVISKKSRILKQEADTIMALHPRLESRVGSKIGKKYLLVNAPLCSKARVWMEERGWRVDQYM